MVGQVIGTLWNDATNAANTAASNVQSQVEDAVSNAAHNALSNAAQAAQAGILQAAMDIVAKLFSYQFGGDPLKALHNFQAFATFPLPNIGEFMTWLRDRRPDLMKVTELENIKGMYLLYMWSEKRRIVRVPAGWPGGFPNGTLFAASKVYAAFGIDLEPTLAKITADGNWDGPAVSKQLGDQDVVLTQSAAAEVAARVAQAAAAQAASTGNSSAASALQSVADRIRNTNQARPRPRTTGNEGAGLSTGALAVGTVLLLMLMKPGR